MKQQHIIRALLVALTFTLSTCHPAYAQQRAHSQQAPSWQGSITPAVRLTVRDKFGDLTLHDYAATFEVTAPNGRRFYAPVQVTGDAEAEAIYPRSFPGALDWPGRYAWACVVNGETVLRGTFIFATALEFGPQPKRRTNRRGR